MARKLSELPGGGTPVDTDRFVGFSDTPLGESYTALAVANYVNGKVIDGAPSGLNTLNEIAAALGNDASYSTTNAAALAGKQPLDADLTAIAGLVSAANKVPYATGSGTWALADLTAFGRTLAALSDAKSLDALSELSPADRAKLVRAEAVPITTTWSISGFSGFTAYGTAGSVVPAGTNYLTRRHRITYTSATTADATAGVRGSAWIYVADGFRYTAHFGVSQLPLNPRLFVGLYAAATAISGEPDALLGTAFFGCKSTDSTIKLYTNDGSGTATVAGDTGIALVAEAFYRAEIWAPAGGGAIRGRLTRLDNSTVSSDILATTNIPANTDTLHPHIVGALNGTDTGTAFVLDASMLVIRTSA